MARKISKEFNFLNPDAEIFEQIKNQQPTWWKLFREDKELYIDIRKDNYINVYYFGGSLAKIEYKNGFVAKIHEKYLSGEGEKYTLLDLNGLDAVIEQIKDNIKTYYVETGNPEKPAEKKIQGTLITKNQNYIDSEFQYNEDSEIGELRIDLIELSDGELSFVELKGITDNRLRNDENRNSEVPEIIEQMDKYQKFINKYANELTGYYKKLIQLKNDLGLSKNSTNFVLNKKPKLLIANTYTKMTKEREERIKAIESLLRMHNIAYKIEKYGT